MNHQTITQSIKLLMVAVHFIDIIDNDLNPNKYTNIKCVLHKKLLSNYLTFKNVLK